MELIIKLLITIFKFIFKVIGLILRVIFGAIFLVLIFIVEAIEWLFVHGFGILWAFLDKNIFTILGLGCWVLAVYVFIIYKPHPAAIYIKSYKKGKISKDKVKEKILSTIYNPFKGNIPSSINSKVIEKRVQALRKRIKAEEGLLEDVVEYIKTKSRME